MAKTAEPLLAHTLPSLQKLAHKELNLGAQETLDNLTTLYERGLISYPRTDCGYLPSVLSKQARKLVKSFGAMVLVHDAYEKCFGVDHRMKGPVWDDEKVTAHHGIIPLAQGAVHLYGRTPHQLSVYFMVVERFLRLFSR